MIYCKKLGKQVNTIKKFRMNKILKILVIKFFFSSAALAINQDNKKEIYLGCYVNSKQYLGPKKAKEYCLCTTQMLAYKYSDAEIDEIFKKKPEEIMHATEFAATHCENNKKAIK